jgi:hypothetical protein
MFYLSVRASYRNRLSYTTADQMQLILDSITENSQDIAQITLAIYSKLKTHPVPSLEDGSMS